MATNLHIEGAFSMINKQLNELEANEEYFKRYYKQKHHLTDNLEIVNQIKLVTGPPRSYKTTETLKEALNTEEDIQLVFVARTLNNLESAIETYSSQHVREQISEDLLPFIQRVGTQKLCENFPDSDISYNLQRLRHRNDCRGTGGRPDPQLFRNVVFQGQNLDIDRAQQIGDDFGHCPALIVEEAIRTALHDNHAFTVFTTYSGLPLMLDRTNFLDNASNPVFIFDEARYIPTLSRHKNVGLKPSNSEKDHLKIVDEWLKESLRSLTIPDKLNRNANKDWVNILEENLQKLQDYIITKSWQKQFQDSEESLQHLLNENRVPAIDRNQKSGISKSINRLKNVENIPSEELEHLLAQEKPEFEGLSSLKSKIESLLVSGSEDLQPLYEIIELMNTLSKENVEAGFDFIQNDQGKNSVSLIFREIENCRESREIFNEILDSASSTYLIDSTPPPIENKVLLDWWWDLETSEVKAETTGEKPNIRIVVENAKYSIRNFWRDAEKNLSKCRDIASELDGTVAFFARTKNEAEKLEKNGFPNVYYARGTEAEGVNIEEEHVVCLGIPLQNIHSEDYVKHDLGKIASTDDPKEKEDLVERYRRVKAHQELLQIAFRSVDDQHTATVVVLGTDEKEFDRMAGNWSWLQDIDIEFLDRGQRIKEKVFQIAHYSKTGRLPIPRRKHQLRADMVGVLKYREDIETSTDLINALQDELEESYNYTDIRNERQVLEERGIIEKEKIQEVPPTYSLRLVENPKGSSRIFWD